MSHCGPRFFFLILFVLVGSTSVIPAEESRVVHKDLVFATVDGTDLKLNLFLPDKAVHPPLVIYIHGGGWRNGSYQKNLVPWMTDHGFALASVSYRLTDKATFPAQIHDVKASVRWLRAHAEKYGFDATRIGVCGTSAGGHLAMLLGMSGDVEALEGNVGGQADQSSRVQAVVNYYGPSDFVLRSKTQPAKTESPDGSAYLLLNGKASEQPDKAKLASPAWQVSQDDPPLLILHGEKDATVFLDQAERIRDAYDAAGLPVACHFQNCAGHGGAVFFQGPNRTRVVDFFSKHLSP
ncbi:MAG: alpha/beta hydrolase [Verrucomicrobiales bacterium]|nr:alpha/beta hydrolase [Verrucomicrobiales bacterium]